MSYIFKETSPFDFIFYSLTGAAIVLSIGRLLSPLLEISSQSISYTTSWIFIIVGLLLISSTYVTGGDNDENTNGSRLSVIGKEMQISAYSKELRILIVILLFGGIISWLVITVLF